MRTSNTASSRKLSGAESWASKSSLRHAGSTGASPPDPEQDGPEEVSKVIPLAQEEGSKEVSKLILLDGINPREVSKEVSKEGSNLILSHLHIRYS